MTKELSQHDKETLLTIARFSIQSLLQKKPLPEITLGDYSKPLQEPGACFVTLTMEGKLRGCVGSIEAIQPLILDVRDRAIGAAFQDYRFPNLVESELEEVQIEISCLTKPSTLTYSSLDELIQLFQPGIDGVILRDMGRRGTFLPQVWNQLPEPELFLSRLCLKMGLDQSAWKSGTMQIETYQVEKFQEDSQGRSISNS